MNQDSSGVNLRAPHSTQKSRPDEKCFRKPKATKNLETKPHSLSESPKSEKISLTNQNSKYLDQFHPKSENPIQKDGNLKPKASKNLGKTHLRSEGPKPDEGVVLNSEGLGNEYLEAADQNTNISNNNLTESCLQTEGRQPEANIQSKSQNVVENEKDFIPLSIASVLTPLDNHFKGRNVVENEKGFIPLSIASVSTPLEGQLSRDVVENEEEFIPLSRASVSTSQGHKTTEKSVDSQCLAKNTGSKIESQHLGNKLNNPGNLCTMCNGSRSLNEFQRTKTSGAFDNLYTTCTGSQILDQTPGLKTSEAIQVQEKPETFTSGLENPQRVATEQVSCQEGSDKIANSLKMKKDLGTNKEKAKHPIVVKGKPHNSWESISKCEASSNFDHKTHKFRKPKHEDLTTATSECLIKPKEHIGLATQSLWKDLDSDSLTSVVGFDTGLGQGSEQIDSKRSESGDVVSNQLIGLSEASVSQNLVNNFSEKAQSKRVVGNNNEFIPMSVASPFRTLSTTPSKKPKLEDTNPISTSSWNKHGAIPKKEHKSVSTNTDFNFLKRGDSKNKIEDEGLDTVFKPLNRASNEVRNVVPKFNLNKFEQFSASVSKPLKIDSENEHRSPENEVNSAKTEKVEPDQFQLFSGQAGHCISYLSSIFTPKYNYCPLSLICLIKKHKNSKQSVKLRLILDSCSNVTLLKRQVCEDLKLDQKGCQLNFGSTGGKTSNYPHEMETNFVLQSLDGKYTTKVIQAVTLDKVAQPFHRPILDTSKFHIDNWTENYGEPNKVTEVSLLLGQPYQSLLQIGTVQTKLGEPIVVKTHLGTCLSVDMNQVLKPWESSGSEDLKDLSFTPKSRDQVQNLSTLTQKAQALDVHDGKPQGPAASRLADSSSLEASVDEVIRKWMDLEWVSLSPRDFPELNNDKSAEEFAAEELLKNGTTYDVENQCYITTLPWRNVPISSPNRKKAYAIMESWLHKLQSKDPLFLEQYISAFSDMIKWNFIEKVPKKDLGKTENYHVIATLPVKQPLKIDHPCRICFQANQITDSGQSLNSCLFTGQDILQNLIKTTIRFRSHKYVCTTDISRMYHRIVIDPQSRDYLRLFILVKDPDTGQIKIDLYRSKTLVFGLNCSPYIAQWIVRTHAQKYLGTEYDRASRTILKTAYLDDTIVLTNDKKELATLVKQVVHIYSTASMPCGKFTSNLTECLEELPQEQHNPKKTVSCLGTQWNTLTDEITFKFIESELTLGEIDPSKLTKRSFLSHLAKVYDPCGMLSSWTIKGRRTLQKMWSENLLWDQPLPQSLASEASDWIQDMKLLDSIRLPRSFLRDEASEIIGINVFCDSSMYAFASNVYLLVREGDGSLTSHLVFSKSKLRPLGRKLQCLTTELSIVRLELLSMVLAVTHGQFVQSCFDKPLPIKYFSDSQVNLARLMRDHLIYRPFVSNRLKQVKEKSDINSWYYVKSQENPSDGPSRGMDLKDLLSSRDWNHGPSFLIDESTNYDAMSISKIKAIKAYKQASDEERKISAQVDLTFDQMIQDESSEQSNLNCHSLQLLGPNDHLLANQNFRDFWLKKDPDNPQNRGFLNKYSTWGKCVRVLSRCLQFIKKLKQKVANKSKKPSRVAFKLNMDPRDQVILGQFVLSQDQIREAEMFIVRVAQFDYYQEEIQALIQHGKVDKTSKIYRLQPFFDEVDKVIRIKGRPPQMDLIAIPPKHRVAELFVRWLHLTGYHLGTLPLRQRLESLGYFLIQGRAGFKQAQACCSCRKPRPLVQEYGAAPQARYPTGTHTGLYIALDYCGPFTYYQDKTPKKCYILVISDLVSRYINLEICSDMTTATFINALRAYFAQNGLARQLFTDRGTNFLGAESTLRRTLRSLDWSEIRDMKTPQGGFDWVFSTAKKPIGAVEIAVKATKKGLYKALQFDRKLKQPTRLTFDEFRTLALECISFTNNRPVGKVFDSGTPNDSLMHITPAQLRFGRSATVPSPSMTIDQIQSEYRDVNKLYKIRKKVMAEFWQIFRQNFVRDLRIIPKWTEKTGEKIEPGTLVLYQDSQHAKPGTYQLGCVIRTHYRSNGCPSKFTLRTQSNKNPIEREIRACSLLEHDMNILKKKDHSCPLQDL